MIDKIGPQSTSRTSGVSPSPSSGAPAANRPAPKGASFEEVLQGRLNGPSAVVGLPPIDGKLRFSAHAQERLRSREIELDSAGVARLEQAVDRAGQKGARQSLVLMDDLALLVSVRNRVVVTALQPSSAKDNVFTNIDSVVIA